MADVLLGLCMCNMWCRQLLAWCPDTPRTGGAVQQWLDSLESVDDQLAAMEVHISALHTQVAQQTVCDVVQGLAMQQAAYASTSSARSAGHDASAQDCNRPASPTMFPRVLICGIMLGTRRQLYFDIGNYQ